MKFTRGRGTKNSLDIGMKQIYKEWLKHNGIIDRHEKNSGELMHLIHMDSEDEMTHEQILFIKRVITNVKDDLLAMGFYYLLNHIPIFIVGEARMRKISPLNDYDSDLPPAEYIGWYLRVSQANIPTIYICLDRIKNSVNNSQQIFEALDISEDVLLNYIIALVVIHEFAHALMDNPAFDFDLSDEQREAFDWIEEPMANAFTLRIAKEFKNEPKFFKVVNLFVEGQPEKYKAGWDYYDDEILNDWRKWIDKKVDNKNYPKPNSDLKAIKKFLNDTILRNV